MNKKLGFIFNDNNGYFPIFHISLGWRSKISLADNIIGIRWKNYKVIFNGRKFIVGKNEKYNFLYNLKTLIHLFTKFKLFTFSRLLNKKQKKYILINDRLDKAGDNGEFLFRHICNEKDKSLKNKTYFVIDSKSLDFNRLKQIGKVVKYGSIKHKFLFLNTKYIYTSHLNDSMYDPFCKDIINCGNLKRLYNDLSDYKLIWLQHGIFMNNISSYITNNNLSYVIVSSNGEYAELQKDRYCVQKEKVLLTGLPRYDFLYNRKKNIISVSPTWRQWLSRNTFDNKIFFDKKTFEESEYYKMWVNFLSDKRLLQLLDINNYKLNFLLHFEVNKYADCFKLLENKWINIVKQENVKYQKCFAESKMLITDYSSVATDFAYLNKPVIYFQFDKEKFYNEHYKKGWFSYEKNGFGEVVNTSKELTNLLEIYFERNFTIKTKYKNRIDNFFVYHDKNSSKRILDATYIPKED